MEVNELKSFYNTMYINPTNESVNKFFDKSKSYYRTNSSKIFPFTDRKNARINVSHQDPLYPNFKFSKFILIKNRDIHHKIQETLTSERKTKFLYSMMQDREQRIKLLKMPRIKKISTRKTKDNFFSNPNLPPFQNALTKLKEQNNDQDVFPPINKQTKEETISKLLGTKISTNLKFAWVISELNGWIPEAREGATLTAIGNKVYLFGGLSRKLFNQISFLKEISFINSNMNERFKWFDISYNENEYIPLERFGHTAARYGRDLVIFGGAKKYNKTANIRECFGEISFFHTESQTWELIKSSTSALSQKRHNHVSCIVGKYLLVHGGVNELKYFYEDIIIANLDLIYKAGQMNSWITLTTKGEPPGKLAFHACSLVLTEDKLMDPFYNMFQSAEPALGQNSNVKTINEGIYFFGGRDEHGYLHNKLFVLKLNKSDPEWNSPEVTGLAPLARYGHTMNYDPEMKIIIIFGGRNDKNFQLSGSFNLNDICVLNVTDQLTWTNFQIIGNTPSPRYSHCAVIFDNCLIVFGGIQDSGYCTSELCILELDQNETSIIKKNEDKKKSLDISIMGKVFLYIVIKKFKEFLDRKGISKPLLKQYIKSKE